MTIQLFALLPIVDDERSVSCMTAAATAAQARMQAMQSGAEFGINWESASEVVCRLVTHLGGRCLLKAIHFFGSAPADHVDAPALK